MVKAWRYKTAKVEWIPWDDSDKKSNDNYTKVTNYKEKSKKEDKFVTKKYDQEGNLILKIVEKEYDDFLKKIKKETKYMQTLYIYDYDIDGNCIKEDEYAYVIPYKVTLENDEIIERERAVDFNESRRSHMVTHYKYDDKGNRIEKRLAVVKRGKNIVPIRLLGAEKITYIYNANRDIIKELARNACRPAKGRTFSYRYHDALEE